LDVADISGGELSKGTLVSPSRSTAFAKLGHRLEVREEIGVLLVALVLECLAYSARIFDQAVGPQGP